MVDETTNDSTPNPSSVPDDQSAPPAKPATGLPAGSATPFTAPTTPAAPTSAPQAPGLPQTQYVAQGTKKPVSGVVPGKFGEPELSQEEKNKQTEAAASAAQNGNTIGPAPKGAVAWLDNLRGEIMKRVAPAQFDAQGNRVPHTFGDVVGGAVTAPIRLAQGAGELYGGTDEDASGKLPTKDSEAKANKQAIAGANDIIGGFFDAAGPAALVTQPEAIPFMAAYSGAAAASNKGLTAAGLSPETSELITNVALLAGPGLYHAAEISGRGAEAAKQGQQAAVNLAHSIALRSLEFSPNLSEQAPAVQSRVINDAARSLMSDYAKDETSQRDWAMKLVGLDPSKYLEAAGEQESAAPAQKVLNAEPVAAPNEQKALPPAPPHITFESIGGTEVKAPEPATRPSELAPNREVMIQDQRRAGGQGEQTADLPALHPEEHAELEAQAGRPLTTAEAANFRNNQLITQTNQRMAGTGEGTRDEITNAREPHRAELEQTWTPPENLQKGIPKSEAVTTTIPLDKLSIDDSAYNKTLSDNFHGRGSKTEGPVSVVFNPQNGQYLVEDGVHRLVEAHQNGETSVPVKLWSGYSDTASVMPEHQADLSPISISPNLESNAFPSMARRAGVGGVNRTLPEESNFADEALNGGGERLTNDADMGNGGKAWLNTDGRVIPQDRIHKDGLENLWAGNIRIGNLEREGPVLFHAENAPTEAQRAAIGKDIARQGVIYDLKGEDGKRTSGEAHSAGDFWRTVDKVYPKQNAALESRATPTHEIQSEGPEWERTHNIIVDGKKVGSVMVKTDPTGHAQIAGSQVAPDMRGQGLAQSAYRAAIAEAQANGATRITSDSTNVSPDANRVWEKLRDKGLPVENITHPNGKPGYQIDFENPAEPPASLESVAKQAGVAFRGVQQGVGDKAIAIFQDPISKTSFTVDANNWSPEKFQQSLSAARERMQAAQHDPQFQEKLISRGQALGQKIDLSPTYGETGRGIGGFLEHALPGETPEERRQNYIANLGNTMGTDLMPVPKNRMTTGGTEHDLGSHELAHPVQAALEGFPTEGSEVMSHLHPETHPFAAATTKIPFDKIPGAVVHANGNVGFSKTRMREVGPAIVRVLLAAGHVQQAAHGMSIDANAGLFSDNQAAHAVAAAIGFSPEDILAFIAAQRAELAKQWTPEMLAVVKNAAATREEGLSKTLLHSASKVQDVIQKVKEAQNAETKKGDAGRTSPNIHPLGGKTQPGGEGETAKTDLGGYDEKAVSPDAEARKVAKQPETKQQRALDLAKTIGGRVVGSAAKKEGSPRDIDIRIEGSYNKDEVENKMKNIGFEPAGSHLVSPKEAARANKPYAAGWNRGERFEHPDGTKVDIWHDDLEKLETAPVSYPKAGKTVDGLTVGDYVPNTESISASLPDWQEHSGIREVPIEDLGTGHVTKTPKIRALADKIKNSGRIAPLIVVVDKDGPYILEGSHRFDALHMLGKKSFPALVVDDTESLSQNGEKTTYPILDLESEEKSSLSPKLEYRIQPKHQEEFRDAVTNTPGAKINEDGSITLNLSRRQKPEQAGARAIRSGVFFLPETKSPFASYYTGRGNYGGSQQIAENKVTFKNPIVVKGATGGKVPERVYDYLHGKNAYADMRKDVLQSLDVFNLSISLMSADEKEQRVGDLLANYGADSDFAYDIVAASKMGNQLLLAIQEHIVAQAIRNAGYDALLGYSKHKGQPRLSEVFDIGRESYPSPRASEPPMPELNAEAAPKVEEKPIWWNEPSDNKFAPSMTKGEEVLDWISRHKPAQEDGKYVLYHATPVEGGATDMIRAGSLLAEDPETALHQASRERGPKAGQIKVGKILVNPEDIKPGIWASVRNDHPVSEWFNPMPAQKFREP